MQRPATVRLRTSLFEDAIAIVDRVRPRTCRSTTSRGAWPPRAASCSARSPRSATPTFRRASHGRAHGARRRAARRADLTVREVAQRVGYRQPAQFAKAFRRRHGTTPSRYRSARPASQRPDARSGGGAQRRLAAAQTRRDSARERTGGALGRRCAPALPDVVARHPRNQKFPAIWVRRHGGAP